MGSLLSDGPRHTVAQAKIDAARITQASGNAKRAASATLSRTSQSLGNQRIMDAAGKQVNSITENLGRNLDAAASGKIESRLAASESLGSSIAEAAAAGVGGSSIDAYNETMRLQQNMKEEQGDRQVNSQVISASNSRGAAMSNAVASLNDDAINANQDFTQYADDIKTSGLTKAITLAGAAAATYFGGPQAGAAVLSLGEANAAANRGDFAGESRSLSSAFSLGMSGVDTYKSGADADHVGGQAWGKKAFSSIKIK